MGYPEEESAKRRRRGAIQKAVLGAVAVSGLLLIAMTAPNAVQLLGKLPRNMYRFNNQAKTALARLKARGLVRFVRKKDGRHYAQLTDAGRRELAISEMALASKRPKRWDGRWRVVMFDIPEKRRKTRDRLRARMVAMGFYRLQDSAWVYPYDCEDVISLLKAELHLGGAVQYLIADIGNDRRLRQEFGLFKS